MTPNTHTEMQKKTRLILDALEAHFGPQKRPERDPMEVLIRGILSQNTSDANSSRAFDALIKQFSGWDQIRNAPLRELEQTIRCGGLARQKATAIQAVLSHLARRGQYDLDYIRTMTIAEAEKELTDIKGIGIKTARLVLLFGFGKEAFVVDTHVLRICRRLGLVNDRCGRIKAHTVMSSLIPPQRSYSAHICMIQLGRTLCRASAPICAKCPVNGYCLHGRTL